MHYFVELRFYCAGEIAYQYATCRWPVQTKSTSEGQKTNVVPVERPEKDKSKLFYDVKND
jgi:hypothetical protein